MSCYEISTRQNDEILGMLRELDGSPSASQRELSARLGISLGKVNFLLRALIRKGLVKVDNFKKSEHKTAYLYYLTPQGIEEKTKLTYHFLQRKIREYEQIEIEIRQLTKEANVKGFPLKEKARGSDF